MIGKPLTAGGQTSAVTYVGFERSKMSLSSGSTATVCGSGSSQAVHAVDADYFTFSAGIFTCRKAGTYTVRYFARGAQGTSSTVGPSVNNAYTVLKGSSSIASGNASGHTGATGSVNVTLAVGDTLSMTCRNTASSTQEHEGGFAICTT